MLFKPLLSLSLELYIGVDTCFIECGCFVSWNVKKKKKSIEHRCFFKQNECHILNIVVRKDLKIQLTEDFSPKQMIRLY